MALSEAEELEMLELEEAAGNLAEPEEAAIPDEQPEAATEEAPFVAQVGRGMIDVYAGAAQLGTNIIEKAKTYEKAIDVLDKPGSIGNTFAKSIVSAVVALNQDDTSDFSKQVSEDLRLYNKNNPDLQAGRILGNIATPLTLISGGSAKSLGGKMLQGFTSGSLFASLQPTENTDEFWSEKGEQILWGGGVGTAIPVGGQLFKVVGGWIDEITKPLYKSGIVRDVGKFLKEHITENKDKIIKALDKAHKSGDKRTVGQIIADSTKDTGEDFGGMLVRLEKDLSRESDSLKSLYARQSQGRRKVIDALAGTDDDFSAAISKRAKDGAEDYAKAFKAQVVPDTELKGILNNKFAKTAIKEATDIAQAKGSEGVSETLHFVKLGLDKQLTKTGDLALSKAEKKVVGEVKGRLVKWMEAKNPLYNEARKNYQLNSAPINRMELGREIRNKLVSSLDADTPSTFATAIKDAPKLLKKATGSPRYKKLTDILTPDEVSGLNKISKELTVEKRAAKMASASKPVLGKMSSEVEFSLPHILSRPIVIANHLLRKLGQDKSPEYKAVLGTLMKNPDEFIRIYGGSSDNVKTKAAIDIARRLSTLTAAQQTAQKAGEE